MTDDDTGFIAATVSFLATIAYGWLALAGLIAAGLWSGDARVVVCGLLAAGAAYLAQSCITSDSFKAGRALQGVAVVVWLGGVIALAL